MFKLISKQHTNPTIKRLRYITLFLAAAIIILAVPIADAQEKGAKSQQEKGKVSDQSDDAKRWYLIIGSGNNHPRLKSASKQIDTQVNQTLRLAAPGFDDVRTLADQRDEFGIWTPYLGIGRTLSSHWDLFFQSGYSAGGVRTDTSDTSIILLPLHTDVRFDRSSFFAGLGLGYYPFGMTERRKYESIGDRLKSAKPFVVSTLNWNYLTFDADVRVGLGPFQELFRIKLDEKWSSWSTGLSLGVDVPVTKNTVFAMNAQYNHFFTNSDDFSGPSANFYWKYYF